MQVFARNRHPASAAWVPRTREGKTFSNSPPLANNDFRELAISDGTTLTVNRN